MDQIRRTQSRDPVSKYTTPNTQVNFEQMFRVV